MRFIDKLMAAECMQIIDYAVERRAILFNVITADNQHKRRRIEPFVLSIN
jgi:hypothetical protein